MYETNRFCFLVLRNMLEYFKQNSSSVLSAVQDLRLYVSIIQILKQKWPNTQLICYKVIYKNRTVVYQKQNKLESFSLFLNFNKKRSIHFIFKLYTLNATLPYFFLFEILFIICYSSNVWICCLFDYSTFYISRKWST